MLGQVILMKVENGGTGGPGKYVQNNENQRRKILKIIYIIGPQINK